MRFWLLSILLNVACAQATELEGCAATEVTDSLGVKLTFWQHKFEDGARDLVMAQSPADIKRVTFNNMQNCAYQVLAIAEGANEKERWGWHLAWSDNKTIYYARMDGEAWVSSVPKKIVAENVSQLHFAQSAGLLTLSWQAADGAYQMQSDDEGRSWQPLTKMVTKN